jgi:hypothetical protein
MPARHDVLTHKHLRDQDIHHRTAIADLGPRTQV